MLLEDRYNVADAVVVGNLLISLLRHTDRVHSASLAQLVNVIAPIMTEPGGRSWKQTIFHPFAQASRYAKGDVLQVAVEAPTYETAKYGDAALVDAVATRDAETGDVALFAVNRSLTETRHARGRRALAARPARGRGDHAGQPGPHLVRHGRRRHARWCRAPTRPRPSATAACRSQVPPVSWNVVRLGV